MAKKEDQLNALRRLFEHLKKQEGALTKVNNERQVSEEQNSYFESIYKQNIVSFREKIIQVLHNCEYFPERFDDLMKGSKEFWDHEPNSNCDSSVFIMTKFPEDGDDEAPKLKVVIECVERAIREANHHPRIAIGNSYTDWIWSNVELHLVCCKRGVAILEDRCRKEWNPNVAMEWGWMIGMGRKVLYLREEGFKKERADLLGRPHYEFEWDNPEPGVRKAITKWLVPGQKG